MPPSSANMASKGFHLSMSCGQREEVALTHQSGSLARSVAEDRTRRAASSCTMSAAGRGHLSMMDCSHQLERNKGMKPLTPMRS
jgi:hypothetical protein